MPLKCNNLWDIIDQLMYFQNCLWISYYLLRIYINFDSVNNDNTHLTSIFQENPGKLLAECRHSGFHGARLMEVVVTFGAKYVLSSRNDQKFSMSWNFVKMVENISKPALVTFYNKHIGSILSALEPIWGPGPVACMGRLEARRLWIQFLWEVQSDLCMRIYEFSSNRLS